MKPPHLNTDTLDLLYATDVENLPPKERWLDVEPEEINDRFVVIGEEVIHETVFRGFGGCWPDLHDALDSYDNNAGIPVFVVDLFAEPKNALIDVIFKPEPRRVDNYVARRSLADDHGDPVIP
jgi:hypothetical protein